MPTNLEDLKQGGANESAPGRAESPYLHPEIRKNVIPMLIESFLIHTTTAQPAHSLFSRFLG